MNIKQPEAAYRLNCIGVPGQGKSVYRYQFLSPIYRCVLYNPMHDLNVGEVITVEEFKSRMRQYRRGPLRVTVHPTVRGREGRIDEYDALCAYVYEVGALHYATEEVALISKPNDVPPNMEELHINGRHRAVSLSCYGQRFHQFPLIVRGTTTEIVAYRQTEPDDIKDFEARIRPAVSPVRLNELPDHYFIDWTPEAGAVLCAPLHYREGVNFKTSEGREVSFFADFGKSPLL